MAVIHIENLTFRYPKTATAAIDDLSLHVADGALFGLLGPNGSGKTTLISLIMGLMQPAAGQLSVRTAAGHRPRTAFVPQEYAFYPSLSVRENLRFFAGAKRLRGRHARQRIDAVIAITQLADHVRQRAGQLSGGLKRRLNLAIGLLDEPDLLLLDEPTVGIDPHSRHFILESIRDIHAAGTTLVYTSHYMAEIESLCDRVGILDRGRLLTHGSLRDLLGHHGDGMLDITLTAADAPVTGPADWPDVRMHGDVASIGPCPATDVAAILADLNRRRIGFSQVHYGRRNLEDLFLDLTGRQLRD